MTDEGLKFSDYRNGFYDEFGNRTNNYIIYKYYKGSDNTWKFEEVIKTNAGNYFVVDEKIYFKCNNLLIPINMDFESKTCAACYKIIRKDTTNYKKIVGNKYLCKNEYLGLRLHKQDYSDGTCFYTLQDDMGHFRVNYGNHDISELVKVLELEIEVDKKYEGVLPYIEEKIEQTKKLIEDIKQFM